MKIIVFGATGGVGQHVVKQALEKGIEVTAFVRTPSKVTLKDKNYILYKAMLLIQWKLLKPLEDTISSYRV